MTHVHYCSLNYASYEERAKNFETVIQQHVDFTMFEDFAANVFAPVLPQNATSMFYLAEFIFLLTAAIEFDLNYHFYQKLNTCTSESFKLFVYSNGPVTGP